MAAVSKRQTAPHDETPASQAQTALAALAHIDTTNEATSFANALAQALYQYFEDVFALPQRSTEAIREVGGQAQISEDILTALVDLLTKCDYHRFAPVPLNRDQRDALISRATLVIKDLENLQNA